MRSFSVAPAAMIGLNPNHTKPIMEGYVTLFYFLDCLRFD